MRIFWHIILPVGRFQFESCSKTANLSKSRLKIIPGFGYKIIQCMQVVFL